MGETSYGRSRNLSVNWEFSKKQLFVLVLGQSSNVG